MTVRYLYFSLLILMFAGSTGCTRDRHSSPDVTVVPPYWQSQRQLAQSQLNEMHAFHDKESEKMAEELHVFHNKTERLAATGKELKKERPQQESPPKKPSWSEKWTSWFKKKNKDDAPLVSETNKSVR